MSRQPRSKAKKKEARVMVSDEQGRMYTKPKKQGSLDEWLDEEDDDTVQ